MVVSKNRFEVWLSIPTHVFNTYKLIVDTEREYGRTNNIISMYIHPDYIDKEDGWVTYYNIDFYNKYSIIDLILHTIHKMYYEMPNPWVNPEYSVYLSFDNQKHRHNLKDYTVGEMLQISGENIKQLDNG